GDYEMWKLRIEHYFQVQDYALWDVIENGNSFKLVPRTIANADDLEQIHEDDLKEIDLKWQLALLSMRARRSSNQDNLRKTVNVKDTSSKAMVAIDGAGFDWSYIADDEVPTNMALMAFSGSEDSKSVCVDTSNDIKKAPDAPIIEDWASDSDEDESEEMVLKYENVQHKPEQANQPRKVSQNPRNKRTNWNEISTQKLEVGFQFTKKACFLCGSFSHLIKDCDFHDKKMGYPQDALKNQRYFDSGCSRHMTGNISYLSDFKEHYGGVAFGGGAKCGNITGKGAIRTGKLDFEDVYFVKELQFNLFSVSQMRDKKNSVLFTTTECFVLSPNFKLADESQVLLKVSRKNNIFTWVLFLATKDETSRILKSFITEIENLVEKKVKIIRCDNGTKFRNRIKNEFCEEKSIKREYSVARTPQQNRVAERRNMTLIEEARTMLSDSKLPTKFWAEAVNTACYVQNRVLVIKPHFKTPYELFKGRSHALSFMRPCGCHVTILNTLDQLGKFNGKSNEGIFVGYSTTSKAFKVYNIRTRKVKENLHIAFLKNKPMIAGGGLEWLFDIDAILKSINYAPVPSGTNFNDFASKGASFDAGQSSMETKPSQDYILMLLWKDNSLFNSSSQASDGPNKDKHGPSQASESDNQERPNAESSTKTVNTAGPVNISTPTYADYPNDSFMLDLEDAGIFDDAYDDRDEGAEADYNNLETNEAGLISFINKQRRTNHKDFQNCLFACFLSEMEPKKVTQALDDESWVEAMQEELLHFKLLNVWALVDLSPRKRAIGTKWVYRNKRDKKGSLSEIKPGCAFLYGTIEEEVYVSQPPGFVDPEFPDRVYKVEKLYMVFIKLLEPVSTPMKTHKPLSKDAAGTDIDVHLYRSMIGSLMYLTSSRPDIMFAVCTCSRFQVQLKVSHMHAVKRILRYLKGQPTLGLWYHKDSPLELIAYSNSDYAGASLNRKSTTREYITASNCYGQAFWLQNQLLDYGYNFIHTKIHVDNESAICMVKNHVYHSKTKHIEIRHHFIRDSYEKRLIEMVKIHTDYNVTDLLTKAFDVTRFQFLIASIGLKLQGYLINDGYADLVQHARQTTTGKELSNPLMAGSLPKTTLPTQLVLNVVSAIQLLLDAASILTTAKRKLMLLSINLQLLVIVTAVEVSSINRLLASIKDFHHLHKPIANSITLLFIKPHNIMSTPTFAKTHNLIAFLEKPSESDGFEQIVDFLNANQIKHDLKLNDAEGTSCLPNAVIFEELARMSAKTTSWKEFSNTMASAIICLANNQKFNFSKYILDNLKKNLEAGVPFYMFHRVEKLKEENMSFTKELKSFNSKVESPALKETVVDKEKSFKQGRKIADIDADAGVNLENVYNLDLAYEEIVLSMQDVTDVDGKEVAEEMVKVITTAKIIVDEVSTAGGELNATNEEPVSVAPTNITTAQPSEATKTSVDITTAPKVKEIVFHDVEESTTRTASSKAHVKDKKAKPNNINWNEVVEQVQSRQSDAKQKLEEQQEAEELQRNLEIVPDDEDDVFVNVAPLSSKPPTIVDYKIYKKEKKVHFQIIRANRNHQMYLAFSIMLKNFDGEDLEVLWKIVKDRFNESKPKEVLDVFLWHTLQVMFEHSIEDSV
nr:hypothetical protein [Tanacetum cinerariifolium]